MAKHRLLGLGPHATKQGDKVCLVRRSQVLLILRKVVDRFELIGECYVHAIMDGNGARVFFWPEVIVPFEIW